MSFVQKRRRRWYAVLEVPQSVRSTLGKVRFVQSLKTESKSDAERRALPLIALWKRQIEQARRGPAMVADAEAWRQSILNARDDDEREVFEMVLSDYADELAKKHGDAKAGLFYQVARGQAQLLSDVLEKWIAERGIEGKAAYQHRRAMELLIQRHNTVEELDRRTAGAFVTDILAKDRSPATVNRIITTYSSLWRWLERRGLAEGNPWTNQRLEKKGSEEARRPFSEQEARDFLASLSGVDHDVMLVAAVTGMRLEEITQLKPADVTVKDGATWLQVKEGKSAAAKRSVPVVAKPVRAMLDKRKAANAPLLFPELRPNRFGDYSAALSKRLGRQLRKVVGDAPGLVAGHSWRHRARTLMEHADVAPWTADALLGHARPGEGLGRYAKGPSPEQLIKAARAIKLPLSTGR